MGTAVQTMVISGGKKQKTLRKIWMIRKRFPAPKYNLPETEERGIRGIEALERERN